MVTINKFIRSSEIEDLLGLERNVIWGHINVLLGRNLATSNEFVGTYQDYFVTEAGVALLAEESKVVKNKEMLLELVDLFYEQRDVSETAVAIVDEPQEEVYMEEGIAFVKREDAFLTNTRGIAERFNKRHADVLRAVANLIANGQEQGVDKFFEECYYKDGSGKTNKEYLMGKDGFALLVMGFTGATALEWKVRYIRAFNKMAEHIQNGMVTINQLPPITKALLQLEMNQIELQQQITQTNEKMKALNTTLSISGDTAREDIAKTINHLVKLSGRNHQEFRRETYTLLEAQEHVKLEVRLANAKRRMEKAGEKNVNKLKKIDIICNDKRLLNAYKNILTQMTVNYDLAQ